MIPPKRKNQNDSALSRGNATSGAPICNGMTALARPAKVGVAKSSSISVPCIVKSWLYSSFVFTICRPGLNSSARMSRAMTPARRKNAKDATRYM